MNTRILFVPLLLIACTQSEPATAPAEDPGVERFGAPIGDSPRAEFAKVMAEPDNYAGTVTVEGTVRKVCQAKGCWMELASENGPGARVTFENYGFFVPMDSAGARATVEGRLEVKTMSPEHVHHMESEGASVAGKGDDGSAREVRIVATGVELRRNG